MRRLVPVLVLAVSCSTAEVVETTVTLPTTSTTTAETTTSTVEPVPQGFVMAQIGEGFELPTQLVFSPNGVLWVVEQSGRVRNLAGDLLMDLADDVEGHAGLLGLVFHPEWPHTDTLWYYHVDPATRVGGVYEVTEGTTFVPRLWEEVPDHYGGHLELWDDWLYVAVGDGAHNQEEAMARYPDPERGAVFRYHTQLREWETVATGFRNPFGWTIHDGWLYVGDVGEGLYEEINVTRVGGDVVDFGWPLMEGPDCRVDENLCTDAELTVPAVFYGRDGGCGVVVGSLFTDPGAWLDGALLWTDLCRGDIRASWFSEGVEVASGSWPSPNWITAIAAAEGVVYLAGLDGRIYSATPVG